MSSHKNITGRALHEPAQYKVQNNSGITLVKGTVVKRVGYDVAITVATSLSPTGDKLFGVVVDDIPNGSIGYVAAFGDFGEFDTSGWIPETLLYSSNTGALSDVEEGDPIATVLSQDAENGHILFYVGLPSNSSGGSGGHAVYTTIIAPLDVSSGYIVLPATPLEPSSTVIKYEGAPEQIYGIDFSVAGNQLTFLSLPAESGETITILYK